MGWERLKVNVSHLHKGAWGRGIRRGRARGGFLGVGVGRNILFCGVAEVAREWPGGRTGAMGEEGVIW